MKLLGVDVGFSKERKSTGIACLDGDCLELWRATTSWEDRKSKIPVGFSPEIIAFDGPILPHRSDELTRRTCELAFIRAPFHRRCKPGLSHCGFGLEFRRATIHICSQFQQLSANAERVEAFPNAFLAVLLPEEVFLPAPKLRRGERFDWLYDRTIEDDDLLSRLAGAVDLPSTVWEKLLEEKDHELRAALVCLITAAFSARGKETKVGDDTGGWFWLPSKSLWQPWAIEGLANAVSKCGLAP